MKKNKYLTFVAMAAAALATSCASDDLAGQKQSQTGSQTVTLTASVNDDTNATTRVGMTKEGTNAKFYWHKDDAISVLTVNGSNYSNAKFTTTAENGATTATFTGDVTGKVGAYAVYPYSESHKFTSETALKYNLPAEYTNYKPETKIFGTNADYPTNSINIPLVGKIEEGKIAFKHLGGLAVIRIDKMPAISGTLTVTANQQLSGDFTVSDLSGTPTIATTTGSSSNNTVTFAFDGATSGSAGVFYLPLAIGSYSNVKIGVESGSTNNTVNYGNLYVARASVTAIPLYNYSGTIDNYRDQSCEINGHKFVDLGLSVLWAETNVGADKASGYGNYYAWGEVEVHRQGDGGDQYPGDQNPDQGGSSEADGLYSWSKYKYGASWQDLTKYTSNDNLTTLEASDDVATAKWQSSCRMPTNDEFSELLNSANCNWEWTAKDGVYGWKVTGKKTGNSIFLPASGYYDGDDLKGKGEGSSKADCYYWSSSRNPSDSFYEYAYTLHFYYYYKESKDIERYYGCPVRPVAAKQ